MVWTTGPGVSSHRAGAFSFRWEPIALIVHCTAVRGSFSGMNKFEEYRHFAASCLEMARTLQSATPHERVVLLEMALLWSRLAERAASNEHIADVLTD